ncbi:aspartyl protease family protein [Phenylobacterium sp.]|jgi:predicted aspartyl protease|uniref:aspartyl protease family protein n=2 Tax=Phenylobacterium sp. TaxID=1871053 RepID=UPI002E359062|nr:aspartyl protease family protein [Phenylobacterium sp.]HEX3367693.1 aspartyl protease family protein [Phenylobacterium sp.]
MQRRRFLALSAGISLASGLARAAGAPVQTLDFAFVHDRQILFPITVNGQPAEAWLDSGAGASVLDAAFARQLGVTLGGGIQAHGVAGGVAGVHRACVDLQAGDLTMSGRRVAVIDLSAVARIVPRPVQVLLGRDVFDQAVVDIDFQACKLSLIPRAGFVPPPGRPVSLRPSGDLRSLPIAIDGVATEAILDLGNAGGLLLDRDFAEAHHLLVGHRLSTELAVGADGPRESAQACLDRVQVGGLSFDGVPTVVTVGLTTRAPANIGVQLLSRFRLTIDFAGDRMWMAPYPNATAQPFRKNRTGLSLSPQAPGVLIVDHVALGSPAARGGWKAGELVTELDGRPIAPGYMASDASQWIFGVAGRSVALTLADGTERRLTLADYF